MIGIIGALEVEVEGLKKLLTDKTVKTVGGLDFYSGKIFDKDVVIVKCGIGKIKAALTACALIGNFDVSEIISTGIAGGVCEKAKKLDIVVSQNVIQYDFDLTPCGYKCGQTERGSGPHYDCSNRLVETFFNTASKHTRCHKGTIATGDKFVASNLEARRLEQQFNAIACDMESAAIEQVSRLFNKEFVSIRTISDNADNNAVFDFDVFEKEAADLSIKIITEYLAR